MASRRMFSKTIIDSDLFLDMPLSTQALYFHLCMRADDDGFINNPKKIQRMIGANDNEMRLLIANQFIIPFENGLIVIKHWKIHNYIQKDRYRPTLYTDQKALLEITENNEYQLNNLSVYNMDTDCIQNVSNVDTTRTQNGRLGKVRLGKVRLGKCRVSEKIEECEEEEKQAEKSDPKIVENPVDSSIYENYTEELNEIKKLKNKFGLNT